MYICMHANISMHTLIQKILNTYIDRYDCIHTYIHTYTNLLELFRVRRPRYSGLVHGNRRRAALVGHQSYNVCTGIFYFEYVTFFLCMYVCMYVCMYAQWWNRSHTGEEGVRDETARIQNERSVLVGGHTSRGQNAFSRYLLCMYVCMYVRMNECMYVC